MATTTATVIPQGLALTPDFMAEQGLKLGASVTVIVEEASPQPPANIDRLIEELSELFTGKGGGMAEELQAMRREDERRFQEKW